MLMKIDDKNNLIEFAQKIVSKGMAVPAIFLLESTKYISFIAGQTLIFLGPILTTFVSDKKYYNFTHLLEKKENIEFLITKIEEVSLSLNKQNE
tara:strand:+ start:159 stop:440 length:282 start_codon:yes stop_codon:yes gene_type:complete